jgi:hypothetical protein
MRFILSLVLGLAVLWCGYWFIGSTNLRHHSEAWLQERRAEGWVAEGAVTVAGFPNRFDMTLADLELADPSTGVAWTAPFFKVLALSYQPHHVIAIWPPNQRLAFPDHTLDIQSEHMRGSVKFYAGPSLELERSTVVIDGLQIRSTRSGDTQIPQARLAIEAQDTPATYRLGFETTGAAPSPFHLARLDPLGAMPKVINTLRLDASAQFDKPWDRSAVEQARPQFRHIDLKELRATWGNMDLRMAGAVDVDANGNLEGEIVIKAENWREMIQLAVNAGTLPADFQGMAETVLGGLAQMSGNPRSLDAPLNFARGRMRLGPLPLGPAPRLVLR